MEEAVNFFIEHKHISTILHVLSVVFGMGAALMSDVLFNFYTKDKHLSKTELRTLGVLSRIVFITLPLIILSGVAIFMTNIDKYSHSAKFLSKMTIMAILLVNGIFLDRYIWPHLSKKNFFTRTSERGVRKISFICGTVSVLSWLFVCTLGVLDSVNISYWQILSIYGILLTLGIPVALFIENREFESK